jgi:hypothetical protein
MITANRRRFLQRAALFSGALATIQVVPFSLKGQTGTPAPSKRINAGIIGVGAMGSGHLRRLAGDPGFQLLAVCEADKVRRDKAQQTVNEVYANERTKGTYSGCDAYVHHREMLARPDIDAVLIASPDHWHAFQSIDAALAGKDVYCEKPISVTVQEGRRLVEVIRQKNRVFQTGSQYRSIPVIRQICQFIRDGGLGQVKSVFVQFDKLAGFLGNERFKPCSQALDAAKPGQSYIPLEFSLPEEPIPEGLDWETWVGPAPWRPYNRVYHTNPSPGVVPWSFDSAFGVASTTWHFSHATDVIQYALGMERSNPVEWIHPSTGQFPTMTGKYANGTLLHFVDHLGQIKDLYHAVPADARLAGMFGGVFVGEKGWITTLSSGGAIEGGPDSLFKELGLKTREVNIGSNNHHANWLECIHSRKKPNAEEEIGHRSASTGHLAMISFRLGRSLKWDPVKELFPDDAEANRLLGRTPRKPWTL